MHRPEEGGYVVVLQDGLVVVEDGQVGGGLDVEVVGGPGVVVVVDDGGEEEGEDLQVGHPVLEPGLGDAAVSGLENVAGVQVVVVGSSMTENCHIEKFDRLREYCVTTDQAYPISR